MFFDDTRGEPSMDSVTLDAFISMDESQTPVGLVSACLPLVMEILTTYSVADTMLFGADGLHLSAWPPNERARIERWLTPSSA